MILSRKQKFSFFLTEKAEERKFCLFLLKGYFVCNQTKLMGFLYAQNQRYKLS